MVPFTSYRPASARADATALTDVLRREGLDDEPATTSSTAALDSFDGRIAAAGLRLRLIDGNRLVLSGGRDGEAVTASIEVEQQPSTPADLPHGPLRQRLAAILDVRALLRLVEVISDRTVLTRRNATGKATSSAVVHSRPRTATGDLGHDVVDIIELAGYPKPAAELRDLVEGRGWQRLDGDLVDVAAAASGVRLTGYAVAVGVPLTPGMTAIEGFRTVLANLHEAMVANWDGTIADIDPEFLHDLRVAVRRSRVVLANARRVVDEELRARARTELGWIGTVTGPARDLDVYELEWPAYTADLDAAASAALQPLRRHLGDLRADAHAELARQLTSPRARVDLDVWEQWLDRPVDASLQGDRHDDALATTIARRVRSSHRRMIERGRAITPATPAETVHELRKDGKKLRYLIECFGGLYEKAPRAAFVSRLKALQDVLGSHQDAEVHADALRQLAGEPEREWSVDTLVAIGQLVGRLEQVRVSSRRQLAERFADFDRSKTNDALDALLESAGQAS